jgi:hypothetical protein
MRAMPDAGRRPTANARGATSWDARRPLLRDARRRPAWARIALIALAGGTVGGVAATIVDDPVRITIAGVSEGQVLGAAEAAALQITVDTSGIGASDVSVTMNGADVDVEDADGELVVRPGALVQEGANEVVVRVSGRFVFADRVVTRRFSAVLTTPDLDVARETLRPPGIDPIVLSGFVDDAVALSVNGITVPITNGSFSVEIPPVVPELVVRATHANGNVAERVVAVVDQATPSDYPETRAVHVSSEGWSDPTIRQQVLDLVTTGAINAVQLDIKGEAGTVGYDTSVELARTVARDGPSYDARAALDQLHALDVRVIGRLVCFLDPVLAQWAWANGQPQMVVQSADGTAPLDNNYGSAAFTNFADPTVQQYLTDLAVEAAELGFDEILYDYIRRPEGKLTAMTVPGLVAPAEVEIARFVRATRAALEPYEVELGVSVFGIAATRPRQIAQDIRLLAPNVDYVSPMVYPSHWGDGEYGVDDPNRQPGDIVARSLADFERVVAGSGAAVVPWLQAFSTGGVEYGPTEVQAQIDAAMQTGAHGFLLWNSGSKYDPAILAGSAG